MKTAEQYAEALYEAACEADDAQATVLVLNLVQLLAAKGRTRLLPWIHREYAKLERVRSLSDMAIVRVARRSDVVRHQTAIEADAHTLGIAATELLPLEDATVVGGYSIEARGTRIDRTYKHTLLELYNSFMSSTQ